MKLYVLYEQTCDCDLNQRYFMKHETALDELAKEKNICETKGWTDIWRVSEIETED